MRHSAGFVVWLTGLPASGKSTIAGALVEALGRQGHEHVELLDGDALRTTLNRDLGFSREDRDENVRRVGFVAELLAGNGVAVVVSLVSPYEKAREEVRARIPRFVLVHVDCPIAELERRDPKGHYAMARRGELDRFTGVSDPYEVPARPDMVIRTDRLSPPEAVDQLLRHLERSGYVGAEASS